MKCNPTEILANQLFFLYSHFVVLFLSFLCASDIDERKEGGGGKEGGHVVCCCVLDWTSIAYQVSLSLVLSTGEPCQTVIITRRAATSVTHARRAGRAHVCQVMSPPTAYVPSPLVVCFFFLSFLTIGSHKHILR